MTDLEKQLLAALKQIVAEGTSDRNDYWKSRMMLCSAKNAIRDLEREINQATCVHCDESHDLDADHECKEGE